MHTELRAIQNDIPSHTRLAFLFNTETTVDVAELSRNIQRYILVHKAWMSDVENLVQLLQWDPVSKPADLEV